MRTNIGRHLGGFSKGRKNPVSIIEVKSKTFVRKRRWHTMLKEKMSGGKQKLRPWLEEMISRGEISGLSWLNAEKTKFRIPWKHGGKQDWSPDNSRIFMEWAKHTGKYREGIDDPNYPTWKTRLRCAFNKAPDIQELKEESQLSSHEPYRVYVLTQAKRIKASDLKGLKGIGRGGGGGRKGGGGGGGGEEDEVDGSTTMKTEFSSDVKEVPDSSGIPTMVAEFDSPSSPTEECLSSDLESIFPSGLLTPESTFLLPEAEEGENSSPLLGIDCQFDGTYPTDASTGEPTESLSYLQEETSCDKFLSLLQNDDSEKLDQLPMTHSPKLDFRVNLELFYCGQRVLHRESNIKSGLRLVVDGYATNSLGPDFATLPNPAEHLLSKDPPTVHLPLCDNLLSSKSLEQMVNHVLTRSLSQGLLLWMSDDGDIFACRFCPGAIYHISQTETNGKPVKIPRNIDRPEAVKIFSYSDGYRRERISYAAGLRPNAPEATIHLSCGQPVNVDEIPERVYVCLKITPFGLDDETFSESPRGMPNDVEMEGSLMYNVGGYLGNCPSSIPCDMEADDDDDDDDESRLTDEQ